MCGDLQYGVGGGIHDHFAGFHMSFGEFIEDFRTAGGFVADDFMSCTIFKFFYQVIRETVVRKGDERLVDAEPHDFPVAGHRILTKADFLHFSVITAGTRYGIDPLDLMEVAQAHGLHRRKMQSADRLGDMTDGVGAFISVFGGIRHRAEPHRVHDDREYAWIATHFDSPCFLFAGWNASYA